MILSSMRLLWVEVFPDQQQVTIKKGYLDLREWDAEEGGILLLDGEWEFYPMQWLLDGSGQDTSGGPKPPKLIAVPGDGIKLCMVMAKRLHMDLLPIACVF